jgi:hypothetical protein
VESSGSGSLSDYDTETAGTGGAKGEGVDSSGVGAGRPGKGRCRERLSTALEDVARSEYYEQHERSPRVDTAVDLAPSLVGGRLAVVETASGHVVGLLPTRLNYLLPCLEEGFSYVGHVIRATTGTLPEVLVALEHVEP